MYRYFISIWRNASDNIRGALLVALGGLLLIMMAAIVKHLVQTLPAYQVLFIRFLAGFLIILPVVFRMGFKVLCTEKLHYHFARGFYGFMGNLLFFLALIHIALADTVTIQFSRPLFIILIVAFFYGEKVNTARKIITVAGFVGIVMITKPFFGEFNPWVISAVGGAFFASLVVLTVKLLTRTEHTVTIMFYFAAFTTILSLIPAVMTWQTPTAIELILMILAGAFGIVGQGIFTHGIGKGETSFVMPFDYLRIVYSFLFGIIWFSEAPGGWSFLGAVIIIIASLYLIKTESKNQNN
jgi:drug/metabolite transporter (DMT)-like permease